jgi:glycerol-3-phosphate acyltransferase PlsY
VFYKTQSIGSSGGGQETVNTALVGVTVVVAYLLGSLPAGYLLGRLWGVNVLEYGSGRTGGTNVFRSAGVVPALLTGALDIGKGALAVWIAGHICPEACQSTAQVLAGAAVILGHNHSLFLGFHGGAGVGTSLGALGAIHLPAAIGLLVLLLVVIAITRYASIGSLTVMTLMPIILLILGVTGALPLVYLLYGLLAWIIVVYSHRTNIQRLLLGNERRLGNRREMHS